MSLSDTIEYFVRKHVGWSNLLLGSTFSQWGVQITSKIILKLFI